MRNTISKSKLRKLANWRAAKERKRLAHGQSEAEEELRWKHGAELEKTNP